MTLALLYNFFPSFECALLLLFGVLVHTDLQPFFSKFQAMHFSVSPVLPSIHKVECTPRSAVINIANSDRNAFPQCTGDIAPLRQILWSLFRYLSPQYCCAQNIDSPISVRMLRPQMQPLHQNLSLRFVDHWEEGTEGLSQQQVGEDCCKIMSSWIWKSQVHELTTAVAAWIKLA